MTVRKPSIAEMLDIQSVAIIGVSMKLGYYWVHSMLQWPHDLKVWLVSKREGEVLGHKIYADIDDIPDKIDYAIVAVPRKVVLPVLKQVADKGAKGATVFTSGYSELGTPDGKEEERKFKELVEGIPMRVFGPNCMGLCYPRLGFAFAPTIIKRMGDVGFISQSGGVAISTYTAGAESGVGFSKLFSFGNSVDIKPPELIRYFQDDDETKVIGAYIEGVESGSELLTEMKVLAKKKPVVVLKGGRSVEGSRAVSSHTGALAGSQDIWSAAFRQANVPTVTTLEELVATLSVFSLSPKPKSRNIGMVAISGGTSVIYTDMCVGAGLKVPTTSTDTLEKLDPLIRDVGTSLKNPIDLAADYYSDQTTAEVLRLVGAEPNFDSLIFEADVHHIHQVATIMGAADVVVDFWRAMAEAAREVSIRHEKPVLVAVPDIAYPQARKEAWDIFVEKKLPVFRNMQEAVTALSKVCDYYEVRERRSNM
ncbi:MAG: hypothetical protein BAJATHORv1_60120 [Candidatus Thorarchaeota archaeon]|nr:MAG: hypothetical protein BAJATHORv1_60120 [Candidatus Thorarchaeota archaeon]